MTLKKYQHYKNTNIQWLGQIPQHWEVKRIKDVTELRNRKALKKHQKIGLENIQSFTGKYIPTETEFEGEGILFKAGDILFGKLRPYLAKVYLSDFEGSAVGDFFVIGINQLKINGRFINYIFLNQAFLALVNSSTFGAKMPRVNWDFFSNIISILPPLTEQTAIANYLDQKTAQIDKKVTLLTQKIEKYKEFKKSLINETVCRGLDKSVSLKPSNIAWIGDIPEHWEIVRMKDIAQSINSGATPLTAIEGYYDDGIMNWVNTGDLNDGLVTSCQKQISELALKNYPNLKIQKKGTLIIALYGATIGKLGLLDIEATTNQACCCIYFKKGYNNRYIFYWLLANKNEIISQSIGGTQPNISQSIIQRLEIPLSKKYSEQTAIAQYLDEKTNKIDQITANLSQQIATLKELRKTLINEVVTGKVKV